MFKELLITEFLVNKKLLVISLLINCVIFFPIGPSDGMDTREFMSITMVSFWVLLIASGIIYSDEKRVRQFIQLPVSATEVFASGWALVLIWLGLQVFIWLLYGFLFDIEFGSVLIADIFATALGMATLIGFVSIGIDLNSVKPPYVLWMYLGSLFGLFVVAMNLELFDNIERNVDGFYVFPMGLIADGGLEIFLSVLLVIGLMIADYVAFIYRDSYLN